MYPFYRICAISLCWQTHDRRIRKQFYGSPSPKLESGIFININKKFKWFFSCSREEVLDKSALDVNIWKSPGWLARFVDRYLEKKQSESYSQLQEFITEVSTPLFYKGKQGLYKKMKIFFQLGALALIAYFTIFTNRGLLNLDVMEARNIVTAREMVINNTWLIPTMNDEIRIAKPPLPTWITTLPLIITKSDDNFSALRIPACVAACLMIFFVYFLTRTLSNSPLVPFLSAAVIASSELLMITGKQASWDIFCHTFMLGAICLLVSGWKKEKYSSLLFIFAGVLMGLSFMSKGPIAFHSMLLPFLISYIYVFGYRNISMKWKGTLLAIVICLVIAAAWPLYIYYSLPDAVMAVGTTEMQTWMVKKFKPIWYYLPFPVHSGIWICLMISALIYPLLKKIPYSPDDKDNYRFSIIWIILTVVLLSLVPKKSTRYLLPVIVPSSLMIGFFLRHLLTVFQEKQQAFADRVVISIHEIIVIVLSLGSFAICLYYQTFVNQTSLVTDYLPPVVFIAIAALSFYYYKHKKVLNLFITSIVCVCSFCLFILPIIRHMTHQKSFMALKMSREETRGQNFPFYTSDEMEIKDIWAIGRIIKRKELKNIEPTQMPFIYFSRQSPAAFLKSTKTLPVSIKSTNSYVGNKPTETWYVSTIDKL